MEKLTVSLTPAQVRWLQEEAKRLGVSVAELLRRIVDRARGENV